MNKGSLVLTLVIAFSLIGRGHPAGVIVRPQTGTSDWPLAGGGPARTGEASGAGPVMNPAVIWQYVYPQNEMLSRCW